MWEIKRSWPTIPDELLFMDSPVVNFDALDNRQIRTLMPQMNPNTTNKCASNVRLMCAHW